jgi:hypothetical protein
MDLRSCRQAKQTSAARPGVGEKMGKKSPEAERFKVTETLKEILAFAAQHPFDKFEQYPIKEIREAAIKGMYSWDCRPNGGERSDWAEQCISGLLQNCDQEMAKNVLEWYLYESDPEEAAARAIRFALTLKNPSSFHNDHHFIQPNDLAKMITGRIKKNPRLYSLAPKLSDFYRTFLKQLQERSTYSSKKYYDDDWYPAERALHIIALVKDITLLPILENLAALFRDKKLQPDDNKNELTKQLHYATITATIKILKKEFF